MEDEIKGPWDLIGKIRRPLELKEVASILGISRQRVQMLERRALAKMKKNGRELLELWRD